MTWAGRLGALLTMLLVGLRWLLLVFGGLRLDVAEQVIWMLCLFGCAVVMLMQHETWAIQRDRIRELLEEKAELEKDNAELGKYNDRLLQRSKPDLS